MRKPVILCVDDERSVLQGLRIQLELEFADRFAFEVADSGEEGLEVLQDLLEDGHTIPVVISDQLMPGMKGDEFLKRVHQINPAIRKILLTGQASLAAVGAAVNSANLYRYISKPWNEQDLRLTVDEAAKSYFLDMRLKRQLQVMSDLNVSAQELSREVQPAALAEKMLAICMEDIGADKGFIQLVLPNNTIQYISERKKAACDSRSVLTQSAANFYPHTWAEYSFRQKGPVFGKPNVVAKTVGNDPYIAVTRAAAGYCAAIVKNDAIQGTLYLELNKQEFTSEHIEFLSLFLAQASISIDNALLYQNLEDKVAERTRTIEEKNQDILDSLYYARRIQTSLLPRTEILAGLFPEYFILYLPKDVVSGDFYWFTPYNDCFLLAAVDCTGHGVPGAFMSVVGNNLLNQIVKEHEGLAANEILNLLHQLLKETLNRGKEQAQTHTADGMDLSLCKIDVKNRKMQFSAANRPILIVRDHTLIEIKGDRSAIGGSIFTNTDDASFTLRDVPLEAGDVVYLFTDGITDQFGGKKVKKLGYSRLKELLVDFDKQNVCLDDQQKALFTVFEEWKGRLVQTDDLLIMGVKIP